MIRYTGKISFTLALLMTVWSLSGCKTVDKAKDKAAEANKEASALQKDAQEAKASAEETKAETEAAADDAATKASLAAAVADDNRPAKDIARDVYRHPVDTLLFFGVKPDSTVLELWPGRGWYTRILGPYVGAKGKLYVTNYSAADSSEYRAKLSTEYAETLKTIPNNTRFSAIEVLPPENINFGLENEADVVLTFRNVHNWKKDGSDKVIYAEALKALKPGGVFGVVEHRAPEGTTWEESADTGYVDQQLLIEEIEAAGFKFVESSEVNANAKDTKNYPKGVWTLPPSLKLKEQDADKYLEIGESDRMTLKFIKPVQ